LLAGISTYLHTQNEITTQELHLLLGTSEMELE